MVGSIEAIRSMHVFATIQAIFTSQHTSTLSIMLTDIVGHARGKAGGRLIIAHEDSSIVIYDGKYISMSDKYSITIHKQQTQIDLPL